MKSYVIWTLLLCALAWALPSHAAGPSLAAAFQAEQGWFPAEVVEDPAKTQEIQRVRFLRNRHTHRLGVIVTTVGAAAFVPGATMWIAGIFGDNPGLGVAGAAIVVGATGAIVGGEVAALVASHSASKAVELAFGRRVPRGFAIAGAIVFGSGLVLAPFTAGIGAIVGIAGGLGLSIGQMSLAGRTLDELGVAELRIVPRPGGLAVVARF